MNKYALLIEYNGYNYCGWQRQLDQFTLQQELEQALSKFAAEDITIITAGRTDSGVHALGQVIHFETNVQRKLHGWVAGVNRYLSANIRVKQVCQVEATFDARFSALSREYHYYLLVGSTPSAHLSNLVGYYSYPLNLSAMQQAAQYLLGEHDFSAFRASSCQANNPIRNLSIARIEQNGSIIKFIFKANAFLHHMVRNLVGALVYVGNGKLTPEQLALILANKQRSDAPPTFMPNGLYLAEVSYPQTLFNYQPAQWLYNL